MEPLPPGWRVLLDALYLRLDSLERAYRYVLGAFVMLALLTPLDNLLEIPHGVFLWVSGADRPFAEWKRDYDPVAVANSPTVMTAQGLDLRGLPPVTALPSIGFYWMLAFTAIFMGGQYWFFPKWGVSFAIPVFGLFAGGLAGGALLLLLEYAAGLRLVDTKFRAAARPGGWVGSFAQLFGGWQNRPWVYLVVLATALAAAWLAVRLLRRDPVWGRLLMLLILCIGAAAESLAGFAVDLATRIRQPAAFLTGTFVSLLIGAPMVLWTVGPLIKAWRLHRASSSGGP